MIDLHAHILPGLDDGPIDLDSSAALAAAAVGDGTRVMAASSHINRSFGLGPGDLSAARARVEEHLKGAGIRLDVIQGGEVAASRVDTLRDAELAQLTLGGTRWVLLECPLSPSAPPLDGAVAALHARGFRVLLAHPERSPAYMRSPEPLMRLTSQGVLAQVTAGAFAGEFGGIVRRTAFTMLESGLVHVLASDAHDAVHRPPTMRRALAALEERYDDARDQFDWLALGVPEALLADRGLPERPPPPRAKGGPLRRLRGGRSR